MSNNIELYKEYRRKMLEARFADEDMTEDYYIDEMDALWKKMNAEEKILIEDFCTQENKNDK